MKESNFDGGSSDKLPSKFTEPSMTIQDIDELLMMNVHQSTSFCKSKKDVNYENIAPFLLVYLI